MANDLMPNFHFRITDIQTVTFPLPSSVLTLDRNRRFFVSMTDGKITKDTRAAFLDLQSLLWNENLDGFVVESSSQITLKVFEKHLFRQNVVLATFVIPYDVLRSSRNVMLQSVDTSKKNKAPSRLISVTWSERLLISAGPNHAVEEIRSHLQVTKEDALKMKNAGVAVNIAGVSNSVGRVLDTAGKVIPSIEFLAKCKVVLDQLEFVVHAVDTIAEIHPYAKIAWSVISFIPTKISEQIYLDKSMFDLLAEIEVALDLAPDADALRSRCKKSDRHEKTLCRLLEQITECGHFIQSYVKDVNFGERFFKHLISDGKTVVENFRQKLKKFRGDFVSEVIVTVETNVFRILAEVEFISEDVRALGKGIKAVDLDVKLQKLPYGQGTDFNPERGCLPQTRVKFLDEIVSWVNDPSSPPVLLLFGQAGTGKSSIAHEIARRFRSWDRLTASYCFVRGKPSSRDCYRFFTTLTHNFCNKYPAFKDALSKVINNNPGVVEMQAYTTLFESLLRDPLQDVGFVGPVFIVVDALDESEDASEMRRWDTLAFHEFLATRLGELPSNFRILITSRPEPDLEKAFSEPSLIRKMYMNDAKLTVGLDGDMMIYMRTRLSKVKGVTEDDLEKLVKKAEGNFQWAFVACSHIARPPSGLDSRRCIQRVLEPTIGHPGMALNPLDELYTTILKRFNMKDREVSNNFKSVMNLILGASEPLSVDTLDIFVSSKDDPPNVSAIVEDLGSLLSHVTPLESGLPVAPLHNSFRDFLIDKSRSGDFHVHLDNAHKELGLAALRTMEQRLKFNICELQTSYLLNSEVPDLKNRVENNISPALSYSCRFWASHLAYIPNFDFNAFASLQAFMKERFLFWLEVLSVTGEMAVTMPALYSLQRWLNQTHDEAQIGDMDALVEDAIAFVCYFGYPIARSAPHIYLSALPFSPSSSMIFRLYMSRFSTLQLETGRLTKWSASEMTILVDKGAVRCIAWSRDGEYIAAGVDSRVHVFNTSTGMCVSGPFHVEDRLASIAFSHDGQQLALGLWEGKTWIKDLARERKIEVQGPWTPVGVSAVAFSWDDKQLVLGLFDGRVWVWDLEKAETLGGPFIGHNNSVWEVSFLDQEHIVSRSGFRTVRVWNVKTRMNVTRMDVATGIIDSAVYQSKYFIHDPSHVKSSFRVCSWTEAVAGEEHYTGTEKKWGEWSPIATFSPDGKLVATCGRDHVHVWFAMGGMVGSLAGGPFSNEDGLSLAFSTNGRHIASGAKNGSLRVWSVQLVDEDESSNRKPPWSVAFMPDGEQIVVGWKDGRVEILDASTGQTVVRVTEGDTKDHWTFVAVSPNGDRIVSARDKEMCIWTRTGKAVAGPLRSSDHEPFRSVAFSPDSNDLVAYGTWPGTVCVLNASTGGMIAGPMKFNAFVTSLALSPSINNGSTTMGTRVALGVQDEMFIWDILTGNVVGPFTHHRNIYALAFSSDGTIITSVADDYTLCVWDAFNGKAVRGPAEFPDRQRVVFDNHPSPSTRRIALSLDGRRVAFMGIDNTVLLFDVLYEGDSDVFLHGSSVLAGHVHALNSFAFSRDSRYMATTSNDRTIKIWDLQAAMEHKKALDNSVFIESELFNLDETWFDDTGWAASTDIGDGVKRLIWVPETHRSGLYRPSNTCVVGGQRDTRLDLGRFVHGKSWANCWLGFEQS